MKVKNSAVSGSFFVLILMFFGCKPSNNVVEIVRIFYLPQDMSVMTAIDSCDKIFEYSEFLKDTFIIDNDFITDMNEQIEKLTIQSDSLNSCDIRIRCVLKEKGGSKKILCLGEYFGTIYDGVPMNDNAQLRSLIKEEIYK